MDKISSIISDEIPFILPWCFSIIWVMTDWTLCVSLLLCSLPCHFFTFRIPPMTASFYSLRKYKLTISFSSMHVTHHRHCNKLITMAQRPISLSNLTCKMILFFPIFRAWYKWHKDWPHAGPIHTYYACACTRRGGGCKLEKAINTLKRIESR